MKRSQRLVLGFGLGGAMLGGAVVFRGRVKHAVDRTSELVAAKQQPRKAHPLDVAERIYDGKLGDGWADRGWGPHRLGSGPAQIAFASFGGILLHHGELPSAYAALSFRYLAPEASGKFLLVSLRNKGAGDEAFPHVNVELKDVAILPGGWREVLIDWPALNPSGAPFDGVMIGARSDVKSDWVLLDQVVLTKSSIAQVERQDSLQVQCDRPSRPISSLIYGSSSEVWESGQTAQRLGGNPMSRFNWELGAWNVGKDWFFENIQQPHTLFEMIDTRAAAKHATALVVPTIGWVAKDGTSFGFPRSLGAQSKYDPYKSDAGDGMGTNGKPITPGRPEQTSVPAPPELIQSWISKIVSDDAKRESKGVQIYILDNEPSLWNETHRDVRPQPLSYDELLDRSIKYARAIRQADPRAIIAGPAEWGWLGYQYSAVDREAGYKEQPDRMAHAQMALVPWFLRQMAEQEHQSGVRLLDMLDLHFYPAADKIFGGNAQTDPSTAALRLRSTRALWDPDYTDESWIGEPIRLIPRMRDWVRQNYPGLKLALGEWNFGAEDHISGGLATAEALGRFGQQGLDAAFHWGDLKVGTPAYWAFRAFRNFDGAGARFLDLSVPVKEGHDVSLFASRDEAENRLVLVLINRSQTSKVQVSIDLQGCKRIQSSRLFSYTGQTLAPGVASVTEARASAKLDASSLSVLELTLGDAALR